MIHCEEIWTDNKMDVWRLLCFCVIYFSAAIQALLVETQAGLTVSVVMETHVYQNQSDFFRFEVQSCETADVILKNRGHYETSAVITLSQTGTESIVKICYRNFGMKKCGQVVQGFTTPDFCLAPAVFWVWKEGPGQHALGTGCTKGLGMLTDILSGSGAVDTDYTEMEVTSAASSKWKFGESVCAPPTTTVNQTTPPLERATQSSTTATTTPGNDFDNTLKCPTDKGRVDRSSAEVTCSVTWSVMTLAFAYTLTINS